MSDTALMLPTADQAIELVRVQQNILERVISSGILAEANLAKKQDGDYGAIPGAGKKKVLFKSGAEKLCAAFNVAFEFFLKDKVENWETGLFYYEVECRLTERSTGILVGSIFASCNSREQRYAYRWLKAEEAKIYIKDFHAGNYASRSNSYGTQYQVPNPHIFDEVNTIQKMAEKRALVAAALIAFGASAMFTQDMEDRVVEEAFIEGSFVDERKNQQQKPVEPPPPPITVDEIDLWIQGISGIPLKTLEKDYGVQIENRAPEELLVEVFTTVVNLDGVYLHPTSVNWAEGSNNTVLEFRLGKGNIVFFAYEKDNIATALKYLGDDLSGEVHIRIGKREGASRYRVVAYREEEWSTKQTEEEQQPQVSE